MLVMYLNMGDVFDVKYFGVDPRTGKDKVSRKGFYLKARRIC